MLYVTCPTLPSLLARLEGPAWVEAQEWYEGEGSLAHAVSAWENKGDDHDEVVTVILGEGGYHRFPVLETGEVVFSRYSGSKDVAEKATALGFRVI